MKKQILSFRHLTWITGIAVGIAGLAVAGRAANWTEPPVIHPGHGSQPPSDAIVLFNGQDLSKWASVKGGPAPWKVEDGHMTVIPGTGYIITKQKFGACQLHVEWATPSVVTGKSQNRGNSGVYLQGRYEIQVLDSYDNPTYYDGQAGALYGHRPPLVNVCRKPGQWQTYDIIFHPPQPKAGGQGYTPGSVTVLQNGVLVQDHTPVTGPTTAAKFSGATEDGPLMLQDHGCKVRYRNIWIRPLKE